MDDAQLIDSPWGTVRSHLVQFADNPGLETVTEQLLNESEGMAWHRAGRVHDVDLRCLPLPRR